MTNQPNLPQRHGRTRITPRAIRAVVSAVTAEQLGTSPGTVGVDLADERGTLAVTAKAPIGILPLHTTRRGGVQEHQATVLDRATSAQRSVREQVEALTGSVIGRVNLRLTSARIEEEGRVQ